MIKYGASISVRASRQFGLDVLEVMRWCASDLGIKRFRLMSYWDEVEVDRGRFDFSGVKNQLDLALDLGVEVSFCLGIRQPRWPESHLPQWAKDLGSAELKSSALIFIKATLDAVEGYDCVVEYQLENEALNRGIGLHHNFSRARLKSEYRLVKSLSSKPVVMSTSNSWGLPILGPMPDVVGFSTYLYQWGNSGMKNTFLKPWMVRVRKGCINLILRRPVFCHELQLEPWGGKSTDAMSLTEQFDLMDVGRARSALDFAIDSGFKTIDMWGTEWWMSVRNTPDGKKMLQEIRLRVKDLTQ